MQPKIAVDLPSSKPALYNVSRNDEMLTRSIDTVDTTNLGAGGAEDDSNASATSWELADGVVSNDDGFADDESKESGLETGVLILPALASPMNLSVPDSVPSNVESLNLNPAVPDLLPRNEAEQKKAIRAAFIVACLFFVAASLTPTFYLLWERNELRSTALRLEEQIEHLQSHVISKKQKSRPVRPNPSPSPKAFSWEEPSGCQEGPEPSKLIDTCWMRADAKVQLGECAIKTKRKIKKKLKKLGRTLWQAQEDLLGKMQDVKEQYAEASSHFYSAYNDEKSTSQDETTQREQSVKKRQERLQKIGQTAKSVLSGVAVASAAALIVSGTFLGSFVPSEDNDRQN